MGAPVGAVGDVVTRACGGIALLALSACLESGPGKSGDDSGAAADDTGPGEDTGPDDDTGGAPAGARGLWFWASDGQPGGSATVVGDDAEEAAAIASFQGLGVDRVYGAFRDRPSTEPDTIAAWNARLDAAGIESHLLLSSAVLVDADLEPRLEAHLDDWLVSLHAERPAEERFDGVHLDLEPHASADWSGLDAAGKRDQLLALAALYQALRTHLDENGAADIPLAADLPPWFDTGDSIGWTDTTERDAWLASMGASLTSLTLMTYERPTAERILDAAVDERAGFPGEVRVSVDAVVGDGGTWASVDEMLGVAAELEAEVRVDLHHHASLVAAGWAPE